MRFTIATAILSSAAMVVAVPTIESTIFRRSGGQTCAQGQTLQCCQSTTAGGDGILGNLLGLNCADIPIPILGVVGGKCDSAPVCCNSNGGDTSGGINILTNSCVAVPIII
ncbi:18f9c49e-f11a-471d-8287-b2745f99ea0d [Sclerotinia trifoliorum]|uniref:Hydrophobin n=1 Tax=Sclerotinia trifoliorum TaxID=28548 RepID=A0A8H2W462_9HELO|nr:18f9c49e-f11a-471d-8287-b2745f99ea0d [Sclerotinia trifoliorum]